MDPFFDPLPKGIGKMIFFLFILFTLTNILAVIVIIVFYVTGPRKT